MLQNSLSTLITNANALEYFTWLDQSIAKNGIEILTLLVNEQELNNNNPFTNLFLSLTLSHPNTNFRNTKKALTHLKTFEANWIDEDQNKQFGLFLKQQLEDRKRMVNQRSSLRKKLADAKQQLSAEQSSAVEAKTKLDQLKSAEKSLLRQQSEETKKYRVVK